MRLRSVDGIALAVVLLAPLAIAIPLAPWLAATATPVVVEWAAPEHASLDVVFGDGKDDHVPGVRLNAAGFAAVAPPRPFYRLAFRVQADTAAGVPPLGDVSVVDARTLGVVVRIPGRELALVAAPTGGAGVPSSSPSRVTAWFAHPTEVRVGGSSHATHLAALWLGGAAILGLIWLALRFLARHASTHDRGFLETPAAALPLAISASFVAAVAVVWGLSAPMIVTEDAIAYLQKGDALARTGSFETGREGGELTRGPGYPAFLALVLATCGHSHTAIAIAQGLLHAVAVFFAAFSLRKQVRTPYLVAAILLGGTFLSHLQFARMLLSESVFTSVSLIALGCFWSARTARRRAAAIAWTCAFGAVTAAAVATRPIGIALLAPLAVTWVSGALAAWKAAPHGGRFRAVARGSIPALIAVLIVVGWIGAWSFRNLRARGWFGFAAMASLSDFQGEVLSGTLDPRVLIPFGAYDKLVRESARDSCMWSAWSIYGDVLQKAAAGSPDGQSGVIGRAEEIYGDLYRASRAQLPGAAKLLASVRTAWWNLGVSDLHDEAAGRRVGDLFWALGATPDDVRAKHAWLSEVSGVPMTAFDASLTRIADLFRPVAASYHVLHALLLAAGLVACLFVLAAGRPGLAAPFVFVAANWALLAWLRQSEARYMMVLDVFCIFQILIAAGSRQRSIST